MKNEVHYQHDKRIRKILNNKKAVLILLLAIFNTAIGFAQCSLPSDVVAVLGAQRACPNDSKPYKVAAVPGATNYIWTLPAGCTISGQNPYTGSRQVTVDFGSTFTPPGNITCQASNACGASAPASKTITNNNPTYPGTISGSIAACPSTSQSYSVTLAADVITYQWTIPSGASITGQGTNNVTVTFPSGFTYGNVSVVAQNGCGTTNSSYLSLRAKPFKPDSIMGITSAVCGTTQTYTVDDVYAATSYTWNGPVGSTLISGQGTTSATFSFGPSVSGHVSVTANNACGASNAKYRALTGNIVITQQPQNSFTCLDDTIQFSVTAPGTGLTYQWRKEGENIIDDADFSGSQTSVLSILKSDLINAGNYDVVVSSGCAPSVTSSTAVLSVNSRPSAPVALTAPDHACENTTAIVSAPEISGNITSYLWEPGSGVSIIGGQGTDSVTLAFAVSPYSGYSVRCRSVNECGVSLDTTKIWMRRSLSVPFITSGPTKVCQGQTNVSYTADLLVGSTSNTWSVTPGITIISGQGTATLNVSFSPSFTSGDISLTATNQCMTTAPRIMHVFADIPATPGNITGQVYGNCSSTLNYSIAPSTGATSYNWTVPSGATIQSGQGTTGVSIAFNSAASGNICVSGVGTCAAGPSRCLTVYTAPQTPTAVTSSSSTFCARQTGVVFNATTMTNASKYTWTVPSGAQIVSGQGSSSITVNFGTVGGIVGVTASNMCGNSGTRVLSTPLTCRLSNDLNSSIESEVALDAYPNPANDKINVSFNAASNDQYTIVIADLLGKNLVTKVINAEKGINKISVDLKNIQKGLYLMSLKSANDVHQIRIVVDK